jgi:hypothetical protein
MFLLAAAVIAASVQEPSANQSVAPRVQARATIRILAGATIRFGQAATKNEAVERITRIRAEGSTKPAKLMEFQ